MVRDAAFLNPDELIQTYAQCGIGLKDMSQASFKDVLGQLQKEFDIKVSSEEEARKHVYLFSVYNRGAINAIISEDYRHIGLMVRDEALSPELYIWMPTREEKEDWEILYANQWKVLLSCLLCCLIKAKEERIAIMNQLVYAS